MSALVLTMLLFDCGEPPLADPPWFPHPQHYVNAIKTILGGEQAAVVIPFVGQFTVVGPEDVIWWAMGANGIRPLVDWFVCEWLPMFE